MHQAPPLHWEGTPFLVRALGKIGVSELTPNGTHRMAPSLLLGREDAFGHQLRSLPNAVGLVDAEHGDGRTADRGAAD